MPSDPQKQPAVPIENGDVIDSSMSAKEFDKIYSKLDQLAEEIKKFDDSDKDLGIGLGRERRVLNVHVTNVKNLFEDRVEIDGDFNTQDNVGNGIDSTAPGSDNFISKLALAVLSGVKTEVFFEERDRLEQIFGRHFGESAKSVLRTSTAGQAHLIDNEADLFETIGAEEKDAEENTEYGPTPVKLLKFVDAELQDSILLEHFWKGRQPLRLPFLEWIVSVGNHRSVNVRIKAVDALGKIMCFDKTSFDPIKNYVLSIWATSKNPSIKRLVGRTLSLAIGDSEKDFLSPQVLGLLKFWITQKNDVRLRHTATLVFYSDIGLRFPNVVMKYLDKVTLNEDYTLFFPIAETMHDLFSSGKQKVEMYQIVLNTLDNWSKSKERSMRYRVSQFIIWIIMQQKTQSEETANQKWTTLLWLIKKDKDVFGRLIRDIFTRSLFGEKTHLDLIFGEMRKWTESSSKNEGQYLYLRWLCYEIMHYGNEQESKRLLSYLLWWKDSFKIGPAKRMIAEFSGAKIISTFNAEIQQLLLNQGSENSYG